MVFVLKKNNVVGQVLVQVIVMTLIAVLALVAGAVLTAYLLHHEELYGDYVISIPAPYWALALMAGVNVLINFVEMTKDTMMNLLLMAPVLALSALVAAIVFNNKFKDHVTQSLKGDLGSTRYEHFERSFKCCGHDSWKDYCVLYNQTVQSHCLAELPDRCCQNNCTVTSVYKPCNDVTNAWYDALFFTYIGALFLFVLVSLYRYRTIANMK